MVVGCFGVILLTETSVFFRLIGEMDVDATQALDFTDDDETDDELTEQQEKQPVTVNSDL